MRYLKQLAPGIRKGEVIGLFENGDRVQELFVMKIAGADGYESTPCLSGQFLCFDPGKQDWIEFTQFQKTGP